MTIDFVIDVTKNKSCHPGLRAGVHKARQIVPLHHLTGGLETVGVQLLKPLF